MPSHNDLEIVCVRADYLLDWSKGIKCVRECGREYFFFHIEKCLAVAFTLNRTRARKKIRQIY